MRNEHWISFYGSAVITLLTFAFGPVNEVLIALLIFMATDYATGIMAAILDGSGLCSKAGFRGLLKKVAILCILAVTHHIDNLLGTSVVMLGAVYFYSALELISITENCGRIGLPIPSGVKNAIRMLKERSEADVSSNVESQIHGDQVSSNQTK